MARSTGRTGVARDYPARAKRHCARSPNSTNTEAAAAAVGTALSTGAASGSCLTESGISGDLVIG
jgi:hypothetical protein